MSAGKIDDLLEICAASLTAYNDEELLNPTQAPPTQQVSEQKAPTTSILLS